MIAWFLVICSYLGACIALYRWTLFDAWGRPGFVARTTISPDGRIKKYALYVPCGETEAKLYPLLVWVHGDQGMGTDGRRPLKSGLAPVVWKRHCDGVPTPLFLAFPQSNDHWLGKTETDELRGIVDELIREYPVDTDRIVLLGVDTGIPFVWRLIKDDPGKWAGAIIISARYNRDIPEIEGVPIRWYQSKNDGFVIATVEALRRANCDVDLQQIEGRHFDVTQIAVSDPDLLPWIARQTADSSRFRDESHKLRGSR